MLPNVVPVKIIGSFNDKLIVLAHVTLYPDAVVSVTSMIVGVLIVDIVNDSRSITVVT